MRPSRAQRQAAAIALIPTGGNKQPRRLSVHGQDSALTGGEIELRHRSEAARALRADI